MRKLNLFLASMVVLSTVFLGSGCLERTGGNPNTNPTTKPTSQPAVIDQIHDGAETMQNVVSQPVVQTVASTIPYGNLILLGISALASVVAAVTTKKTHAVVTSGNPQSGAP